MRNSGPKREVLQCVFLCDFKGMDQCSDRIMSLSCEEKCAVREREDQKRVKTFLKKSLSDSRLSNMSTLAIEKSCLTVFPGRKP